MIHIGDLIEGYTVVSFDESDITKLYNILFKYRVRYKSEKSNKTGKVSISIPNSEKRYFKQACAIEGLKINITEEKGLPKLIGNYRTRIGILVGVIIFFALIITSGNYVWRIDIRGNETVSTGDILNQLSNAGFREGDYIPNVDSRLICSKILQSSENIAWIAINFKGNIAEVEIIELEKWDEENGDIGASNLVAGYDALIQSVDIIRGESAVKPGQTVAKGDLLASGIMEGLNSTAFVRCEGEIIGRVTDSIEVDVSFEQTVKSVKNIGCKEIALSFFSKKINIFKYSRNLPSECDTIYKREQIYLFGRFKLPIYIEKIEYVENECHKIILNESDALKLAARKLNDALVYELRDAELLKTNVVGSFYDGGYKIVCTYDSLKNIAFESKIEVSE